MKTTYGEETVLLEVAELACNQGVSSVPLGLFIQRSSRNHRVLAPDSSGKGGGTVLAQHSWNCSTLLWGWEPANRAAWNVLDHSCVKGLLSSYSFRAQRAYTLHELMQSWGLKQDKLAPETMPWTSAPTVCARATQDGDKIILEGPAFASPRVCEPTAREGERQQTGQYWCQRPSQV